MNMVFCRGCGKEIHESAASCPHCGARQTVASPGDKPWLAITAIALAGLTFLASFDISPYDRDEIVGLLILGIASLALSAITLHLKKTGRNLAIGALIFAMLGFLIAIGSTH